MSFPAPWNEVREHAWEWATDQAKTILDLADVALQLRRDVRWVQDRTEHHLADTAPQGPGLPSCVLDVAEQGGLTLDEVGQILGVSRERVRQIETAALRSARATAEAMGHDLQDLLPPPAPVGPWPERSRAPRRDWSTVKRKRAR